MNNEDLLVFGKYVGPWLCSVDVHPGCLYGASRGTADPSGLILYRTREESICPERVCLD